ncbi:MULTISPECIES: penicillin-binding protein activator [Xenorhabdus]|uniref:penicillin-binding protein activator n=1 Tax=Xenorhabdus TaxID=626 RepID=UPI00064A5746|nr:MULTISPECIES: penicillin-binding protein activator [Xenorhabdus]KLU15910.1 penicillin-binding protein activator LpoA [Xenorhabdus griffiniae]KOP34065.1 penicillin-binding protein activator LpoA [Xenorhabdus sp. GDc328]WFQ79268.1 penicillin-binding protein activator [Xenorhabdus sp. SF857]
MLPSIFVRLKTGLIYTALLSTMIIAGCTMPERQGQPTSKPQDKISAEINRYQAIIDAAHNQPSLDVIRAYIVLGSYATDEATRQKNLDETWQLLTQLSPQQMSELVINANEYTLQGWLDLLNTYQTNKQDLDKLRLAIHDWQIRYPDNPAAHSLPTALQQMLQETKNSHATMGLFLPLSGQAKIFGDAIRQGFLDAQKGLPKPSLPESPLPANASAANSGNTDVATTEPDMGVINDVPVNDLTVKIYDTNSQPLTELLEQAKQDGVTLVVGPLLKPNVEQLAQIETPLNILALNELDMPQRRPNICYFSLSPEDEAKNAAMHLWQQQKHSPLVLIPRTELGSRVAKAFAQEWQKLGGHTVLQQSFGTLDEMRKSMNRGIGIRLSGTPVVSTNSATEPVDAVYIVATTSELTTIKPMLDMAISSRKKPALYASSRSNKSDSGPDFRLEMDGMQFSDIPLLTGTNVPLMQQAAKKFTNDYSLMRLYAMGIDAWSLANQFTQMQQEMGFHLNGASGELSVTDNCTILRQLPWMQFNNGRISLENTNNTENINNTKGLDNAGNTNNIESSNNTDSNAVHGSL